jgi:hypothetical protein
MFLMKPILSHDVKPSVIPKNIEGVSSKTITSSQKQESTDQDKLLLCRQCLQVITHQSLRVVINGAHEHTFANPNGFVFEIGCFQSAIGCGYVGQPTDEFSWFAGFMWQVAVCGSCLTHVGWLFTASSIKCFIGLILDRLVESG